MVDPHRPASSTAWAMSQDQIERFIVMERDIKQLRQDVTELESDLKEMKQTLDRIERALAEGRGQSATWPKAGALLIGTITVVGGVGGWIILFYNFAKAGGRVVTGN